MDMQEAQLVVQVIRSGSRYYKAPAGEDYEVGKEGIFIEYDPKTNLFKLRIFEKDGGCDSHFYGYDEQLEVGSHDLFLMLRGQLRFEPGWGRLAEPNNYEFDPVFDPAALAEKRRAKNRAIRERMNVQDLQYLRCRHCKSYNVEPTGYRSDVNPGPAVRYAYLGVHCYDCQQDSAYEWED